MTLLAIGPELTFMLVGMALHASCAQSEERPVEIANADSALIGNSRGGVAFGTCQSDMFAV